eukprot:5330553-Amphidinium_carterae.1
MSSGACLAILFLDRLTHHGDAWPRSKYVLGHRAILHVCGTLVPKQACGVSSPQQPLQSYQ